MILSWTRRLQCLAGCLLLVLFCGCEDGGGGSSSHDFGDNNPDVYVAMGDSITSGLDGEASPYAPRLSVLLGGKTVINEGYSGEHAYEGVQRVDDALWDYKPGYLLILYGANDILHFRDDEEIIENLRRMIRLAIENKTIPVIATLTPMVRSHVNFDAETKRVSAAIRILAGEEGAVLVDLEAAFGSRDADEDPWTLDEDDLLLWDGLHPNDNGNQLMAQTFKNAL